MGSGSRPRFASGWAASGPDLDPDLDPDLVVVARFGRGDPAAGAVGARAGRRFTPIVGAWFAVINRRRLGDAAGARRTSLHYLLPSFVLIALQLALSDQLSKVTRFVTIGWSVTVARQLYIEHKPIYAAHVAAGGKGARWYLVTVPFVVLVLAATALATILMLPKDH